MRALRIAIRALDMVSAQEHRKQRSTEVQSSAPRAPDSRRDAHCGTGRERSTSPNSSHVISLSHTALSLALLSVVLRCLLSSPVPASVFRISFATFAFFFTHALLLCFPLCWLVDSYSWVLKVLYWFGLIVVAFLLPEPFYRDFYVHVSRIAGGVFLLLQVVILVDFAHALNERWNNQPAEKERMYKILILVVSLLLLLASLAVLILLFVWWDSCGLHKFFIGFTLAGTFVICCICVMEKFSERGGILPAAIVTLYCYWLCYSGINSDPRECNHRSTQGVAQLVIGLIVAAGSIAYAGWNVGTHEDLFGTEEAAAAKAQEERADMEAAAGGSEVDREAAHAQVLQLESADSSSEVGLVARQNFRFHLVFAACSMYMAMVSATHTHDARAAPLCVRRTSGACRGAAERRSCISLVLCALRVSCVCAVCVFDPLSSSRIGARSARRRTRISVTAVCPVAHTISALNQCG